ncbi:hypothetical protein ADK41_06785 [Streptomyces caelestis]|uniref:ABC transporter n=1 Tax=Streptomyces caelestis TaxID=36816 RepID=A0A0M8QPR5_9ACTN|nr:hypothetical protein ADK41_06785 [Streptomyces caelestis]KOV20493.1 hypothetical protein ADK58_34600 [Streptomyces sp. XY152]
MLVALHDLNLAACHCDRLYVLDHGRLAAGGPRVEILTSRLPAEVHGVTSEVTTDPRTTAPQVTFLPGAPHPAETAEAPCHGAATRP